MAQQNEGLTQADIARRLGRRPEQIHRWLGSPANCTTDTVSDLLLAISNAEVRVSVDKIETRPVRNYRFPEWVKLDQRDNQSGIRIKASSPPRQIEPGTTAPPMPSDNKIQIMAQA
jgi:transcriptional regulator with XRE-family HTH domain